MVIAVLTLSHPRMALNLRFGPLSLGCGAGNSSVALSQRRLEDRPNAHSRCFSSADAPLLPIYRISPAPGDLSDVRNA